MILTIKRYIVLTADESKILTQRGFANVNKIKQSSPKLFPSAAAGKQDIMNKYLGKPLDVSIKKVEVTYEYED